MRKTILVVFTILLIMNLAFATAASAKEASLLDTARLDKGLVGVNYLTKANVLTKIMIEKNEQKYVYTKYEANETEYFPLQMGDGEYTISVLEQLDGTKYKVVKKEKVTAKITNNNDVYLNAIQTINWNDNMEAVKKAKELTKAAKTDQDKITAIYNYMISTIEYDYAKAKTIAPGYNPAIDDTFTSDKGICYDYAALFAGMLRSVGVPAKLVKGNTTLVKEYHAWNEVYLDEKWVTIDTTIDASLKKAKTTKKIDMIKNSKDYTAEYVY